MNTRAQPSFQQLQKKSYLGTVLKKNKKEKNLENHPKTCAEFYIARAIAITIQVPTLKSVWHRPWRAAVNLWAVAQTHWGFCRRGRGRFLLLEALNALRLRVELSRLIPCLGAHPQPPPGSSSLKAQLHFPYLRQGKMICFSKW